MTDQELTQIFKDIQHRVGRYKRRVEARFYPYRSLRHSIEWTPWRIQVKVGEHFRHAPLYILEYIAIILLAKVYKYTIETKVRRDYRAYNDKLAQTLPGRKPRATTGYLCRGRHFDLCEIFEKLNDSYFNNKLVKPVIGWSKNKSYTRLGFYDRERKLLVISKIFDSSAVPDEIVDYLMYHEMLHIHFPVQPKKGRRIVHSQLFKKEEKIFPKYDQIQHWIKINRFKL